MDRTKYISLGWNFKFPSDNYVNHPILSKTRNEFCKWHILPSNFSRFELLIEIDIRSLARNYIPTQLVHVHVIISTVACAPVFLTNEFFTL